MELRRLHPVIDVIVQNVHGLIQKLDPTRVKTSQSELEPYPDIHLNRGEDDGRFQIT